MASKSVTDPKQSTVQTTTGTSIPTRPMARTSSILNNAQNNNINNNTFVTNIKGDTGASLKAFYNRVSPNAILNAGGRADEVRCHPGTRKEVIGRIEKWRGDAQDGKTDGRMFWLSGPAGAGKSAIVQTVTESWLSRGMHAANFFFFRSDTSRNHAIPLVATLVYQIFDFYPEARTTVEGILATKPRILEASLKEQFDQLVCTPLRSIGGPLPQSIILLVDGLDECDSEEKTSQQQILQALDMLVSQKDVPFLVLVASRVEHQIKMAFKSLSCNIDTIFLNGKYLPEGDIRIFVAAEFERIKRCHDLARGYADWPSASDVDGIVTKSSGQFAYAATAMRFISDSPAAPKLSLRKVQGAARFGSKSPFSQLDALYGYILTQTDDQEALKDILHAELFVSSLPASYPGTKLTLEKCLSIQANKYTDSMINSCIAYVASVARFDHGTLTFYHASLVDYLKDSARSGDYFFDGDAFNLKMVPLLFKHKFTWIAYACMARLKTMTLDIMRAYNTQDGAFLSIRGTISHNLLIPLHNLCVCHDAVAEYRLFLYKWLTDWMAINAFNDKQPLGGIPYIWGYMTMVQIDRVSGDISLDPNIVIGIICSELASEGHDIALWLQNLFLRMYGRYYRDRLGTYKRLLSWWMSWAVSNNVPFSNLHKVPEVKRRKYKGLRLKDIPYGQRYITMARIEHISGDLTQDPGIVLDTLRAESASDIEEITLWLQSLLVCIQRKYYPDCPEAYKRLLRQWISWADSNNIPWFAPQQSSNDKLPRFKLEDLPYGQMYLTMAQIDSVCGDIWEVSDILIDVVLRELASDAEEVAPWIHNLLRSIYAKFYSDHLGTYKHLARQWITWAVSNNIPLSAPLQSSNSNDKPPRFKLEDLPYGQIYLTMAQIDSVCGDIWEVSDILIGVVLQEPASAAEEVAPWIHDLLRSIHTKFYHDHLGTYKQLARQWIGWAVSNNIPLSAPEQFSSDLPRFKLEDIPYGRMYITMAQIDSLCGDIWQDFDLVDNILCPKSASDTEEVALWLKSLLQSIDTKFYADRLKYKQLINDWIIWAISNDIPLIGLDDLPYARRYLIEATMKKWIAGRVNSLLPK